MEGLSQVYRRSIVGLSQVYRRSIPKEGPFYRRPSAVKGPNDELHYLAANIGKNTLKAKMKLMFHTAKIDYSDRKITGHSGKVTLCTRLHNANFAKEMIQMKSGHRSSAVLAYMRPGMEIRKRASNQKHVTLNRIFCSSLCRIQIGGPTFFAK